MKEIVISGIDGSGKTTVISLLEKYFQAYGYSVQVLNYKGVNMQLLNDLERREMPISQELRLFAYCLDLLSAEENSRSKKYDIKIWDRHFLCLEAYFSALDIDISIVKNLEQGMNETDVTFLLHVDPETAVKRIISSGRKTKKLENIEFLQKVQEKYLIGMRQHDCILIDASRSINAVVEDILSRI